MPVHLFTFHAYRSWMPDHPDGYTRRREGQLAPDAEMAEQYERRAVDEEVVFDPALQRALIEESTAAATQQGLQLHAASTEPSHIHLLVSWRTERDWLSVRTRLKTSLSRRLTKEGEARQVVLRLSRGASRRRVEDRDHFWYLMSRYLPDHGGVKWFEDRWLGRRGPLAAGQRPARLRFRGRCSTHGRRAGR